jgi:hypothetical protein
MGLETNNNTSSVILGFVVYLTNNVRRVLSRLNLLYLLYDIVLYTKSYEKQVESSGQIGKKSYFICICLTHKELLLLNKKTRSNDKTANQSARYIVSML